MTQLPKIKSSETLSNKAYNVIRTAILESLIKPNEPVSEIKLAETLGISRTPVRTALEKLKAENLLSVQGNQLMVADLSKKDIKDFFDIRIQLEPFACSMAARNISEDLLDKVEMSIKLQKQAIKKNDYNLYLREEYNFHGSIAKATDNSHLSNILDNLTTQLNRYLVLSTTLFDSSVISTNEHEAIYLALTEKNSEKAEFAMRQHIKNVYERFFNVNQG